MARQQTRNPGNGARHGQPSSVPDKGTTSQPAKPCGCGQSANGRNGSCDCVAEPACCGLDCVEQPRFFCGQLLTDADLTAFLDWTKQRLRLARYRDGWGVVCGLDVRCSPDKAGAVVVSPGYAVTCCGNDVIVCDETTIDIGAACRAPDAPCEIPVGFAATERERRMNRALERANEAGQRDCQEGDPSLENCAPSGGDSCLLDLSIRYCETPTALQSVLRGGACAQVGQCEPSRMVESFKLEWALAAPEDPLRVRVQNWCTCYESIAAPIDGFVSRQPLSPAERERLGERGKNSRELEDWRSARDWLLNTWLARYPLQHFCISDDAICAIGTEQEEKTLRDALRPVPQTDSTRQERQLPRSRLMTLLTLDRLLSLLADQTACDCVACDPAAGVPLARVYAEWDATNQLQVKWVDPAPPYRRLLSRDDCWPACPGTWNLGRFIWRRVPEVIAALSELGFRIDCRELGDETLDELGGILATPPIVGWGVSNRNCCPQDVVSCPPDDIQVCVTWMTGMDGSPRVVAIQQGACNGFDRSKASVQFDTQAETDLIRSMAEARALEAEAAHAEAPPVANLVEEVESKTPKRTRAQKRAAVVPAGFEDLG